MNNDRVQMNTYITVPLTSNHQILISAHGRV